MLNKNIVLLAIAILYTFLACSNIVQYIQIREIKKEINSNNLEDFSGDKEVWTDTAKTEKR